MQHFVFVTLRGSQSCMQTLHTSHPHGLTNTKCRIDTVIPPDDGHTVARNM